MRNATDKYHNEKDQREIRETMRFLKKINGLFCYARQDALLYLYNYIYIHIYLARTADSIRRSLGPYYIILLPTSHVPLGMGPSQGYSQNLFH